MISPKTIVSVTVIVTVFCRIAFAYVSIRHRSHKQLSKFYRLNSPHTSLLQTVLSQETFSKPSDIEAWKKLFTTCPAETCQLLHSSDLPADLEGTYYRNGGAKYEIGKDVVLHPFDSDGMIAAITIKNGSAIFRNKFVRTKGFIREKKEKKICYR